MQAAAGRRNCLDSNYTGEHLTVHIQLREVLMKTCQIITTLAFSMLFAATLNAQPRPARDVDTWVEATGEAAGTNKNAEDEAVQVALRKAVEQTCGVFIRSQTKTEDYQTVYDKVMGNTAGYVLEYKVSKITRGQDTTTAKVRAHVSTVKFEEDWARIAHTIHQEGNPRVIFAIAEAISWNEKGPQYQTESRGTVQSKLEQFFLDKGVQLIDQGVAENITKRDLYLAAVKDNVQEIAAMGAKFKADVVIYGTSSAKFGREISLDTAKLYQYSAVLNVRAVQTDSGRMLMSRNFTISSNQSQKNAEDKALAKVGDEAASKVLGDVLEAWRKKANVTKTVELTIVNMDRKLWKKFQTEASEIPGMQNLRLREITEAVATVDAEYKFDINTLADKLEALEEVKVEVVEQNANRLKLKVIE